MSRRTYKVTWRTWDIDRTYRVYEVTTLHRLPSSSHNLVPSLTVKLTDLCTNETGETRVETAVRQNGDEWTSIGRLEPYSQSLWGVIGGLDLSQRVGQVSLTEPEEHVRVSWGRTGGRGLLLGSNGRKGDLLGPRSGDQGSLEGKGRNRDLLLLLLLLLLLRRLGLTDASLLVGSVKKRLRVADALVSDNDLLLHSQRPAHMPHVAH